MKLKFGKLIERASNGINETEVWKSSCKEITLFSSKVGLMIKPLDGYKNSPTVLELSVEYELQPKPLKLVDILRKVKENSGLDITVKHSLIDNAVAYASINTRFAEVQNKTPMCFTKLIKGLEEQFVSDDFAQILLEAEWFIEE